MFCAVYTAITASGTLFPAEKKCYQPPEKFSKMYAVTDKAADRVCVTIFVHTGSTCDIHIF